MAARVGRALQLGLTVYGGGQRSVLAAAPRAPQVMHSGRSRAGRQSAPARCCCHPSATGARRPGFFHSCTSFFPVLDSPRSPPLLRQELDKLDKLATLPPVHEALSDRYSVFDAASGDPTHGADGQPLEGRALDKAKKDADKQRKVRGRQGVCGQRSVGVCSLSSSTRPGRRRAARGPWLGLCALRVLRLGA